MRHGLGVRKYRLRARIFTLGVHRRLAINYAVDGTRAARDIIVISV